MKKLYLGFKSGNGKKSNLVLNYVEEKLSDEVVADAMNKIVESKLFERKEVQTYHELFDAKYVDRQETPIIKATIK